MINIGLLTAQTLAPEYTLFAVRTNAPATATVEKNGSEKYTEFFRFSIEQAVFYQGDGRNASENGTRMTLITRNRTD